MSKRKAVMNYGMEDFDWSPVEINNEENLTLLSAVCQIVDVVRNSKYNSRIYEIAARPISYIVDLLNITQQQAVVYAIVMDIYYDRQISTMDIARCLDITPLKAMRFEKDLEELCKRNYLIQNLNDNSLSKCYSVTNEAITSLQHNHIIRANSSKVNNSEEWFILLDKIVSAKCQDNIDYDTLCERVDNLVSQNKDLPMIKRYMTKCKALSTEDRMLFLWVCNMVVSDNFETMTPDNFKSLYDNVMTFRTQRKSLATGTSALIRNGLLQIAKSGMQRNRDNYELTPWVIKDMLAELELEVDTNKGRDIIAHTSITSKQLFYNAQEQNSIDQLTALLRPERFTEIRNELKKQGFRSGFACLFHGAPGTGKTETVLQLARMTGRDIMQVNISGIKSMWVGESEKNIKSIFVRYRKLVEESEVTPILLFNEADAIINKRSENTSRSVDKMENAIQNIILEEIENLDGILIATTNLTSNMDKAFERRFIYKIKFEKPSLEAKSAIWQSMITGLSAEDAVTLASKYDFSGGQIENIARKSVVDRIITGREISLDSLYGHCDMELLNKSTVRARVGF